jgi:hypothetical protein
MRIGMVLSVRGGKEGDGRKKIRRQDKREQRRKTDGTLPRTYA